MDFKDEKNKKLDTSDVGMGTDSNLVYQTHEESPGTILPKGNPDAKTNKSSDMGAPSPEEIALLREFLAVSQKKYTTHDCSLCNYPCGYVIINNKPYYDAGVKCPKQFKYCKLEERTEEEFIRYLKQHFRQIYNCARRFFN